MTEPTTLDAEALRARPSRAELRRFWALFRQEYPRVRDQERRGRRGLFTFLLIVSGVGALGAWATIASAIRKGGSDEVRPMALFLFLFLGVFVFSLWGVARTAKGRTSPREHWALAHFAEDNGLVYTPGPRSGTMRAWWSITGHTVARQMTRENADGRTVEWADYEIRNATRRFTYSPVGGWIKIGLRRPLPHIIVRATRRGTRAFAVAAVPDSGQRLSLEGDFDEHFDLYCPEGYEADALYLFTPDVMAQAIDDAGGWDIEIVDDLLLLVHPRDVVTTDPARWAEVIRTADAFATKLEQWERWRETQRRDDPAVDEARLDLTRVAPAGRRLQTSWGLAAWVSFALVAALIVVFFLLGRP
ncbi:hypothetical protein NS220_15405 [Microbacterium testaceum]|uniref:DUF3137 domain-containing protein n=1 Tax=Microbacterium testaceum TaxID=2033 RepID=A0A147ETR1_MICTE|nr:hypothetical protein [Microbacterium testaceum]KTR90223.1 hypothetical protein NS220_15405 [Microbacterium testaceum]